MDVARPTLHCRRCGYDLRGIDPAAACPECGLPVAASLHRVSRYFASPQSFARFREGLRFVSLGSLFLTIPIAPAMQIVGLAVGSVGVGALYAADTTDDATAVRVLRRIAAYGLGVAALGLLATPIVLPRTRLTVDAAVAVAICVGAFGGGAALALWIGRVGALASAGLRRFGAIIAALWGFTGLLAVIQLVRASINLGYYPVVTHRPWYLRPIWGLDSLTLILLVSSALGMALLCMGAWRALGRAAKMEAEHLSPGEPRDQHDS